MGRDVRALDGERLQQLGERLDGLERDPRRAGRTEPRRKLLHGADHLRHEDGRAHVHELLLLSRAFFEIRPARRQADRGVVELGRSVVDRVRESGRVGGRDRAESDGWRRAVRDVDRRDAGEDDESGAFGDDGGVLSWGAGRYVPVAALPAL